jgi:transcriptional regulator with XRE-family HTH domain
MKTIFSVLGDNLRRIRRTHNLTQEELSEVADIHPTYLSGIECGIRNPSLKTISRLAVALQVPEYLLLKENENA